MDRFQRLIQLARARLEGRMWIVWLATAMATGLAALAADSDAKSDGSLPLEESASVDTFIPEGFVLVPIEVVNYEALDSVLGSYGVVDLYAANSERGTRSHQVASRIRILRAPKNPSHFAVLAPAADSAALVRYEGGFYVVIQNPKGGGTRFEEPRRREPRRARSRLQVENQDG